MHNEPSRPVPSERPSERPYQVVLSVGKLDSLPASRVADLTPAEGAAPDAGSVHPVVDRLRDCGLSASDLRSKALFVVGDGVDAATVLAAYAAACGFANRRLDVAVADKTIDAASVDSRARTVAEVDRPEMSPEVIQVGAPHDEILSVGTAGSLSAEEIPLIRWSKRVRLVPPGDPMEAIVQFLVVSALRARGGTERFPVLVRADDPASTEENPVGVDLDALRSAAADLRRHRRADDRGALAERVQLSRRQRDLLAAAATPIEAVLVALGSWSPDGGETWRCPRPERHSHGDAVPSTKVVNSKARCYRCDRERIDSLRLVMDAKQLSGDEAAAWIAAEVVLDAPIPSEPVTPAVA